MGSQNIKYDRPYPIITATAGSNVSMHGKHFVFGAALNTGCHIKTNVASLFKLRVEVSLTGGLVFDIPQCKAV